MIVAFRCKQTQAVFERRTSKFARELEKAALRKLLLIDAAIDINDLRVPRGNNLEKLRGARTGQWSIRVNDQWRICFEWHAGNAGNVEIVDYH